MLSTQNVERNKKIYPQLFHKMWINLFGAESMWKLWINICRSSVENVDEAILQKLLDLMGKSAYN